MEGLIREGRERDGALRHPEKEYAMAPDEVWQPPQSEGNLRLAHCDDVVVDLVKMLWVVQHMLARACVYQLSLQASARAAHSWRGVGRGGG